MAASLPTRVASGRLLTRSGALGVLSACQGLSGDPASRTTAIGQGEDHTGPDGSVVAARPCAGRPGNPSAQNRVPRAVLLIDRRIKRDHGENGAAPILQSTGDDV